MRAVDTGSAYDIYPVWRVARYLKRKLEADSKLRRIGVSGEISGVTVHSSGNVYFDLKDRSALIKCIAWKEEGARLPALANGQQIVAVGSITTYPERGQYQLVVTAIEHDGAGRLHAQYEALKARLQAEGLFATARKRPLPRYPFRLALVSSRNANGAGDFLTQAAKRAPHVSIVLFETPVQGAAAAPEIVRALERAARAAVDLVVITRGGGSFEDLFVFSDERVVRALARCPHPTVSAIGHEADAPLTDFVADIRAETPSTAAQTVLPLRDDLLRAIAQRGASLDRCIGRVIDRSRRELQKIELRSPLWAPRRLLQGRRQTVDDASDRLRAAIATRLAVRRERLGALSARLERCNPSVRLSERRERLALTSYRLRAGAAAALARRGRRLTEAAARLEPAAGFALGRLQTKLRLAEAMLDGRNPTRILQRGYAIVSIDGAIIRDAAAVAPGTRITARVARGTLDALVESVAADGGE